ncbi:DUF3248 domain-containing protein [Deinococcus peraridilitoris]|uniref:DUF3248 domain-containing protein n=1 Tax=Deinococcus peraridilitoris (strain DSM 19664 / LMG 22246 / CIP 109416 / KR-200) TaxID=937777 RepID=K9ZZM6_DEIPD|nr:DUF3248 domain-containing protein [Deinococcus peraridilitoris]AFZ66629.1 Protein of unknown function (DUF3248) [Deinococcus peraridilitoris DSM 19664]
MTDDFSPLLPDPSIAAADDAAGLSGVPEHALSDQLEQLGGHLVWRVGKHEASDDVVVRLGYASSTPRFAHLPRLRSASDSELQDALERGAIMIEWVD